MLALSNTILRRIVWNRELAGNTLIHKVGLRVGVAEFTTIVRPDSSNLQVEWTEEGLRCSNEILEVIRSVRLLNQRNNVGPSSKAINNCEKVLLTSQSRNRNRTTYMSTWRSCNGAVGEVVAIRGKVLVMLPEQQWVHKVASAVGE
jgi:hypothetical protein